MNIFQKIKNFFLDMQDEYIDDWLERHGTRESLYGPRSGGFTSDRAIIDEKLAPAHIPSPDQRVTGRQADLYACNHHHPMTEAQRLVDYGTGPFVADIPLIPLLKALNEAGLITRTHNWSDDGHAFVGIILDERMQVEFRHVTEPDANRDNFRGKQEILISWQSEMLRIPSVRKT